MNCSHTQSKNQIGRQIFYILLGTMLIAACSITSAEHNLATAIVLLLGAVGSYLFIVFAIADRNWLDIRAVFSGVWMLTIGLAVLRLAYYQRPWLTKTWLLMAAGYAMFELGAGLGISFGLNKYESVARKFRDKTFGRFSFKLKESRYFAICVTVTLIGLASFLANVAIRGYVPCFNPDHAAYVNFYTKFHIFAVASTVVSGLCYYTIRTQPISWWKKGILWLCIFYTVILFPILVVSRGTFVVAAMSLTVAVFYLNGRKLWVLLLCMAVIFGVYQFTSSLRDYTDAQMEVFFEPKEIIIDGHKTHSDGNHKSPSDDFLKPGHTLDPESGMQEDDTAGQETFILSPKLSFLYSYLTVGHDNFDLAVEKSVDMTMGCRMLEPFNVILRIPAVRERVANGEYYQVNKYLNTNNILGIFYYDFHSVGVIIFMFLWPILFGIMQSVYEKNRSIFALMILGYAMAPVAFSFFTCWICKFELWMFWGTILLMTLAASIHMKKKSEIRGR